MACYAAATGASLLVYGYPAHGYGRVFTDLGVTASAIAAVMLMMFAVAACVFIAGRADQKAATAASCALLWTLYGVLRVAAGIETGLILPVWGLFEIVGGLGCCAAAIEWSRQA